MSAQERAPLLGGRRESGLASLLVLLDPEDEAEEAVDATARERNRLTAERNQQHARRQQALQTFVVAVALFAVVVLICMSISLFYYGMGWYVLLAHRGAACDQPLWTWLLVYSLLALAVPLLRVERVAHALCCWSRGTAQPFRVRVYKSAMHVVTPSWLLYGSMLLYECETCAKTAPYFHEFILWYLFFMVLNWIVSSVLFFAVLMLSMWLLDNRIVASRRAAGPAVLEKLEVVAFAPELFSDEGTDSRPPPECSICQCEYDEKAPIVKTPCGHYFHKSCLGDWFARDRICPLCRHDVAEEVDCAPEP